MLTPTEKKEIDELKRKVKTIEDWIKQKKLQQITRPLDESSKNIINEL